MLAINSGVQIASPARADKIFPFSYNCGHTETLNGHDVPPME
jgi:hypothetical protein